ncbi:unnamed protein product [Allacma fusca]|uniref:Uncharacterized protein n=1 Tax=Allacma fusca TaxID=39272 RepID=A0A8J2L6Y5_9HEXA|nr:unnamed protein product [Allacma fusca]
MNESGEIIIISSYLSCTKKSHNNRILRSKIFLNIICENHLKKVAFTYIVIFISYPRSHQSQLEDAV